MLDVVDMTQNLVKANWVEGRAGRLSLKRLKFLVALIVVILGSFATAVVGASTLISQGFVASSSAPTGSIVSLQKDASNHVDTTTLGNASNILGVVIGAGSSQLTLSSGQDNQVQVATSGVEQVLVSDLNGKIYAGDQVTASPIDGVGMKASDSAKVVGVAQGDFPNSTSSEHSYKDESGAEHKVMLGQVAILVNVAYFYKQPNKTLVPSAIQNIANALAGKTVNTLPILISVAIFIVTLIVVVSIIYSMIHSSIISVGRNPMSQAAVYRNVIQLSVLVLIILSVSVASIYLILRKF